MSNLDRDEYETIEKDEAVVKSPEKDHSLDSERYDLEKSPSRTEEIEKTKEYTDELMQKLKEISNKKGNKKAVGTKETGKIKQLDSSTLKKLEEKEEMLEKRNSRISNISDFIPVVGSAKMILEGLRGKQYLTDKDITGVKRVVHTLSGIVFLGLDITGVGALASELGKGLAKIAERVALEKVGEGVEHAVVERETGKLVVRGDKRIEKQKKIENS